MHGNKVPYSLWWSCWGLSWGRDLLTEEKGCTEMLPTPFIFGFLGPSPRDHMGPLLGHVVITPPPTHTPPKCFGSVLRRKEHQEWKGSDCHESHPKALGRIRKFGPDRSSWLDLILVTWSYHCCKITKFWTLICVWFISLSTAVNCFYQGLNSYLFNGWMDMAKIIWHELVCVHIAHMKSGN